MSCQRRATPFRVYVGGLDVDATEPDLCAAFTRVGVELAHIALVVNRATGCRRGFVFVAIGGLPAAGADEDAVLARMRVALVNDRPVTVLRIPHEVAFPPVGRSSPAGTAAPSSDC